ncbi:hypothetical protein DFH08DRAFT_819618 [Mycena albidolilacea]|uniref:G domain-containing protein n=1 Tax=Mycena albidolilacea TaxID=1033008 RepID=A0AAD6ZDZ2_9AGAR|nr:hypothetical protein DFH08DRAFT_819618 [Mycena albidolilacea]
MNSDAETPSEDDLSFWNNRKLKFRVLILGRANAGKTTILERLTGASMDEAEVWRNGKILPGQTVKGQIERGLHNINDEICFRSRPGFVFHDSRGVEAGSATEFYTIQRFMHKRSLAATDLRIQLHAIWMCLPLDDSRELFENERDIFRLLKGTAPLVVIFTKQDGAVSKETSQLLMDFPENTRNRSVRKEARRKAELEVINHVKKLEEELRGVGLADSTTAFLMTSGMEKPTVDADKLCQQLINLTEECLTAPIIKTLLSVHWAHIEICSVDAFSLFLGGVKLGSGAPSMWNMIQRICSNMLHHYDRYDRYDPFYFDDNPTDVSVLAVTILMMVVFHAVQPDVLTLVAPTVKDWIQTVASFIEDNKVPLCRKADIITAQVAAIVEEMKHRNIIPQLNLQHLTWDFPDEEATIFATELSQSIMANLM